MKSTFTTLSIAAALLGSSFAFAATPVAPAMQAAPMAATAEAQKATTAVTQPAKKSVKKHASKKVAKKATMPS